MVGDSEFFSWKLRMRPSAAASMTPKLGGVVPVHWNGGYGDFRGLVYFGCGMMFTM